MNKLIISFFLLLISSNTFSQYTTDVKFMIDSLTPLVDEEIVVRYTSDYDNPKYETLKNVITDSTGVVSINAKPGLYNYYWSKYGINKYVWMWGITLVHVDRIGSSRIIEVKWYERTFLPIKDQILSEKDKVYLSDLVKFMKRKPNIKIQFVGHFQGAESEKSNLYQSEKTCKLMKDYLVMKGIDHIRISTRGNGSLDKEALGKRQFRGEIIHSF